jgi:aldehyde dehydrogenase (NAD+)
MNLFQDLFDRQKLHFVTGVTQSHGWRSEQLDRMSRLVAENEAALQQSMARDFKTASQEQIFETRACLGEVAFQKSQLVSTCSWRRCPSAGSGRPAWGTIMESMALTC